MPSARSSGPTRLLAWAGPVPTAAVVLDCDGLLVNTQAAWDRAYLELFERHEVALTSAHITQLTGLDLAAVGNRLAAFLPTRVPASELATAALELVRRHLPDTLAPMPGACELVQSLHGTRPLAVASNAPTSVALGYLERFFDLDCFDAVVGGDRVEAGKPAPDLYVYACKRLGVAPYDAVAFEDSATGAHAALSAGLFLVGVPHPGLSFPCHLQIDSLRDPALGRLLGSCP